MTEIVANVLINIVVGVLIIDRKKTNNIGKQESEENLVTDNFIEIKAYKCPFCGYYSTNKKEIIRHSNECQNNPDYTQECLYCHNLENDFKQRILFPDPKRPYCCYFHNNGECPYKNHTNKKLMEFIEKEKTELSKYGIIENEQDKLVWKTKSENKK